MTLWKYWVDEIKDMDIAVSLVLDCWKFIPFIGILYLYPVIAFEKYSYTSGLIITILITLALRRKRRISSQVMSIVAAFNAIIYTLAGDVACVLISCNFFLICVRHSQAIKFYMEKVDNESKE